MEISALRAGWAEQDPGAWWEHLQKATRRVAILAGIDLGSVHAIGISYQMHGLVLVDRYGQVLRPAIIWCDGRAVETGARAFRHLGPEFCMRRLLNSPGNFTASRLAWVREHEPDVYARADKFLLPGDYIAAKLTGRLATTVSGLSEGILWDFEAGALAGEVLDVLGIEREKVPEVVPTFSVQGEVSRGAAQALGIPVGTPVSYRAGDQPNNALSVNVLHPGEVAATAGTSGVVYGVLDRPGCDPFSRVNTFVHVNHTPERPRYGVLLCVNGTGILNRWVKESLGGKDYDAMNRTAGTVPAGSEGLVFIPYGNGAERTLKNLDLGASVHGVNFNVHGPAHVYRAAQEGIVFALARGVEIMREMGIRVETVRAGNANLYRSPLFRQTFADTVEARVEIYDTDGACAAARGAGLGAGIYTGWEEALRGLDRIATVFPDPATRNSCAEAYGQWRDVLRSIEHAKGLS